MMVDAVDLPKDSSSLLLLLAKIYELKDHPESKPVFYQGTFKSFTTLILLDILQRLRF